MQDFCKGVLISCALVVALPAKAQPTQVFPAQGKQPYVVRPQGSTVQLYRRSAALVVSASRYPAGATGWPALPSTTMEMDTVRDLLVQHGFEVTRVYNPTAQELHQEMQNFLGRYGNHADARLLFFYSGHGYTNSGNQMAYVVPVDAGNPRTDYSNFISRSITLESFHTWVRQFQARHFMAIFDSCFSGAIFTTKSSSDLPDYRPLGLDDRWRYLTNVTNKPVRQFISAGGPDEELPAQSSFVPVFIEGLRGGASSIKDGYVTGKELGVFLERVVSTKRAGKQNPVSGVSRDTGYIFGDMVFQYEPGKAAVINAETTDSGGARRGQASHQTQQQTVRPPDPLSEECKLFDCKKP
ncbi:hypothetical protein ALISP_1282 [Alicycliphilus sp. B1]|nr:hypothetical protein ALISP_1282 [Alicycliphilus sp. B1]